MFLFSKNRDKHQDVHPPIQISPADTLTLYPQDVLLANPNVGTTHCQYFQKALSLSKTQGALE